MADSGPKTDSTRVTGATPGALRPCATICDHRIGRPDAGLGTRPTSRLRADWGTMQEETLLDA